MIQRIQSIFLFIAFLFALLMMFIPVGDIVGEGVKAYVYLDYRWYLQLMAGAVAFLSLVIIFLYKSRNAQIMLCFINLLLTAALMFVIIITVENISEHEKAIVQGSYTWGTFFPFLIIIFTSMALRSIRKDQKLIESMDRLR